MHLTYYFGVRFYVTASDAVAVIAANAVEAIPYFSGGLKGVARFCLDLLDCWIFVYMHACKNLLESYFVL